MSWVTRNFNGIVCMVTTIGCGISVDMNYHGSAIAFGILAVLSFFSIQSS